MSLGRDKKPYRGKTLGRLRSAGGSAGLEAVRALPETVGLGAGDGARWRRTVSEKVTPLHAALATRSGAGLGLVSSPVFRVSRQLRAEAGSQPLLSAPTRGTDHPWPAGLGFLLRRLALPGDLQVGSSGLSPPEGP